MNVPVIGAPGAKPDNHYGAGESYVVFGRDTAQSGNFPAEFELSSMLPAEGGDGLLLFESVVKALATQSALQAVGR